MVNDGRFDLRRIVLLTESVSTDVRAVAEATRLPYTLRPAELRAAWGHSSVFQRIWRFERALLLENSSNSQHFKIRVKFDPRSPLH